jgi:hypothetical protein
MNKLESDQFTYFKTLFYNHGYISMPTAEFLYDLSETLGISATTLEKWTGSILHDEIEWIDLIEKERNVTSWEAIGIFFSEKLYL